MQFATHDSGPANMFEQDCSYLTSETSLSPDATDEGCILLADILPASLLLGHGPRWTG